MAEQLSLQINVGGNVSESLGSLKKQLREAQAEVGALADKFGATSKQAIEAAKKASDLKDRIGDAKALTDAFNPDAKFKALTSSLAGVAGGFAAVQGAIGLFGVESKEVEKTLLKVQSAMALSQGLQAIGESVDSFKQLGAVIKDSTAFVKLNEIANKAAAGAMKLFGVAVETTSTSFKVLKGAIAATGIGLLVVALGFVIEKLMSFSNASDEAAEKQKELNKQLSEGARLGLKDNEKFIDSDIKLKLARAKARGASEKELLDIEQQGIKDKIALRNRAYENALKIDKELSASIAEQNADAQDQLAINELNYQANQLKARQAANAKILAEEKAAAEKLEEGRIAARKKGEAFTNLVVDNRQKQKEKDEEDAKKQAELDEQTLAAEFAKQDELDRKELDRKNKKAVDDKNRKDAELQATIQLEDAKLAVVSGALQLAMGLAGKNKAIADAIFIVDKGLAIARIIVDTQREIAGYAANPLWTALPDGGALIKGKYILGAKLRAGASIATIAATTIGKFTTGSTQGFGGGAGTLGLSAPLQPQGQQAQLTQLNQTSINALGNQAMRAYVVETDVTSSQQRIAAIQQRARFS